MRGLGLAWHVFFQSFEGKLLMSLFHMKWFLGYVLKEFIKNVFLFPIGNENWSGEVIKEAREEIEDLITSHLQHLDTLQTVTPNIYPGVNPPAFAHLHHLAQTLGIIAVLLGCCFTVLKPIKATVTKKNKKRKEPVIMVSIFFL